MCLAATLLLLSSFSPLRAQPRVDPRNTYERIVCVVPLIGQGTHDDPRRPLYAPVPGTQPPSGAGIIAFTSLASDDGKFAIVELVARDRAAFKDILAANRPDVKIFEKGKVKREDVERELRRYKKDLDLDRFGAMLP